MIICNVSMIVSGWNVHNRLGFKRKSRAPLSLQPAKCLAVDTPTSDHFQKEKSADLNRESMACRRISFRLMNKRFGISNCSPFA